MDNLVESETEALCVMEAYIFKTILLKQKGNFTAYLQFHILRAVSWEHRLQNETLLPIIRIRKIRKIQ